MINNAFKWLILTVLFMAGMPAELALAEKKPLSVYISAAGGYDDNTALDSFRKGDGFAQESAAVLYKRLLSSKSQVRLSYSAFNVNYFESTDQNLLLNQPAGGLSFLLAPSTIWENDYTFQYLDFLRNDSVTSYSNEFRTGIRQKLSSRVNLKAGFSYLGREYEVKKLRFGNGLLSADDERSDKRYQIDSRLSFKLNSAVILNVGGIVLWNDSDDQYQDYYDYTAYKISAGFSWQIAQRWSSSFKFTYELRDYDSRLTLTPEATTQSDDSYTALASLYYKINANLTAGSTYTYREKLSNEPSQEYSGALGTLGLYYFF